MKHLKSYTDLGLSSNDQVFNYLIKSLTPVIHDLSFYVNWDKVFKSIEKYKIELGILSSLCTSKNIETDFIDILRKYPEVTLVFPTLIGVREDSIQILEDFKQKDFKFINYDFKRKLTLTEDEIKGYVSFFYSSGLFNFILKGGIQSLRDYSFGVEVGLDSNGRKNRGGDTMENMVKHLITPIVLSNGFELLEQGTSHSVKQKWGLDLPVDKSSRIVDFVINKNGKLIWVETNFYQGGGSKLKSTCGEYTTLYKMCHENNIDFLWITDGRGWLTTEKSLRETFEHTDYILNLSMVKTGVLDEILKST